MRILHLNHSDARGGAARAAWRIHQALCESGVDSQFAALRAEHPGTLPVTLNRPQRLIRRRTLARREGPPALRRTHNWANGRVSSPLMPLLDAHGPFDLIHLHWVNGGLLSVESLRRLHQRTGAPIVWTPHDLWPMTGGCHYPPTGCAGFTQDCAACPLLPGQDLARRNLARKRRAWAGLPLHIAAPSQWMAAEARRSALFADLPIRVIPNPIPTALYQPYDRRTARQVWGLPAEARLLLAGAYDLNDPRKGMALLIAALHALPRMDDLQVVTFGGGTLELGPDAPPVIALGHVSDERTLALLYAAADAFVTPALQDNLPNTVLESLACGTPVAAFALGGLPDLIAHQSTGYLAAPGDADSLAAGIAWTLNAGAEVRNAARESVLARFSPPSVAAHYLDFYQHALGAKP